MFNLKEITDYYSHFFWVEIETNPKFFGNE